MEEWFWDWQCPHVCRHRLFCREPQHEIRLLILSLEPKKELNWISLHTASSFYTGPCCIA